MVYRAAPAADAPRNPERAARTPPADDRGLAQQPASDHGERRRGHQHNHEATSNPMPANKNHTCANGYLARSARAPSLLIDDVNRTPSRSDQNALAYKDQRSRESGALQAWTPPATSCAEQQRHAEQPTRARLELCGNASAARRIRSSSCPPHVKPSSKLANRSSAGTSNNTTPGSVTPNRASTATSAPRSTVLVYVT
jgi:hypothetical protein